MIELPKKWVPSKYTNTVDGATLAKRTRQRNHVILRLKGIYYNCKSLKLPTAEVEQAVFNLKFEQKLDSTFTKHYRAEVAKTNPSYVFSADEMNSLRHKAFWDAMQQDNTLW